MSRAGRPPVPSQAALNTATKPHRSSGSAKTATPIEGTNHEQAISSRSPRLLRRSSGSRKVNAAVTVVTASTTPSDAVIGGELSIDTREKCDFHASRPRLEASSPGPRRNLRSSHQGAPVRPAVPNGRQGLRRRPSSTSPVSLFATRPKCAPSRLEGPPNRPDEGRAGSNDRGHLKPLGDAFDRLQVDVVLTDARASNGDLVSGFVDLSRTMNNRELRWQAGWRISRPIRRSLSRRVRH